MKALIVIDFYTNTENAQQKFIPTEHLALMNELYNNGIDATSLAVTFCFKHNDTSKGSAQDIKEAREKVGKVIATLKPDYILACGDLALRVTTKHRGITKYRGSLIGNVFPVTSHKALHYNVTSKKLFKADIAVFCGLLKNATTDYSELKVLIFDDTSSADSVSMELIHWADVIAYDVETTGLDPKKDIITMLGMCVKSNGLYYAFVFVGKTRIEQGIKLLVANNGKKVAHNSPFDNAFIKEQCNHWNTPPIIHTSYDTMLGGYIDDESTPHSLKYLSRAHCGADMYEKGIDFEQSSDEDLAEYCAKDCYWTLKLREWQLDKLDIRKIKVMAHIMMPGSRLLEKIHRKGVYIDQEVLADSTVKANELKDKLKIKLDSLLPAGCTNVNYNSPAQIKKILYDKFSLKPFKDSFTKKDDLSTGKATLKKYARKGSVFCKTLLEYRGYSKMISSFLDPYKELTELTPRIYPQYNIARTATGRLSSKNPNLQQISRDPMVRHLISAPEGKVFIECDYSQIELRVASWIGNIESMKKLYRQNADIHTNTAKMIAKLGGIIWDRLDKDEVKSWRTRAKAVNFGFIYGMSAQGFLDYADAGYDIILTLKEANAYRDAYFTLYPELKEWHASVKMRGAIDKKVTSPFGRVRHLDNIHSSDSYERGKAERCAINSPVQATASDLTLLSMIFLDQKLDNTCTIVGQCHDAIFFECDEDKIDENCKSIKDTMENLPLNHLFGVEIDVPLIAEPTVGKCWGDGYDWTEN